MHNFTIFYKNCGVKNLQLIISRTFSFAFGDSQCWWMEGCVLWVGGASSCTTPHQFKLKTCDVNLEKKILSVKNKHFI